MQAAVARDVSPPPQSLGSGGVGEHHSSRSHRHGQRWMHRLARGQAERIASSPGIEKRAAVCTPTLARLRSLLIGHPGRVANGHRVDSSTSTSSLAAPCPPIRCAPVNRPPCGPNRPGRVIDPRGLRSAAGPRSWRVGI